MHDQPRVPGSAGSCRRWPRRAPVVLLVLAGATAAGCWPTAPAPEVALTNVRAELVPPGASEPPRWCLLRLTLENHGSEFRGELHVEGVLPGVPDTPRLDPLAYRHPVELPPAAVRRLELPVFAGAWSAVRLRLRAPGYEHVLADLPLVEPSPASLRILVIGERMPALDELRRFAESIVVASQTTAAQRGAYGRACELHSMTPRDLPRAAAGLESFRLAVLFESSLAGAEPRATEALGRWVEAGGSLVVFPGVDWGADLSGLPERLRALMGVDAGRLDAPVPLELTIGGRSVLYRELLPADGSRSGHGGLAVVHDAGAGRVTTLSWTPQATTFPPEAEEELLYGALRGPVVRALSFAGDPEPELRCLETGMPALLTELAGFHPPSVRSVFLGIAAYVLVGLLTPYVVCSRLGRREWTFPAVAGAALLAVVAIYRYGLLSAVPGLALEEITVVRTGAGGGPAAATSFLGTIAPGLTRGSLGLEAQDGDEAGRAGRREVDDVRCRPLGPWSTGSSSVLDVVDGSTVVVPPFTLRPNLMRTFRVDATLPAGTRNVVEVRNDVEDGLGERDILVRNVSEALLHLFLVTGTQYVPEGTLSPGEAWTFDDSRRAGRRDGARFTDRLREVFRDVEPYSDSPWIVQIDRTMLEANQKMLGLPDAGAQGWTLAALLALLTGVSEGDPFRPAPETLPEFREVAPSYLVVSGKLPVFPGGKDFERRNAVTVVVVALESEEPK